MNFQNKNKAEENLGYKQEVPMVKGKEKILLVLLPFWPTLIPPVGISCLKGFLEKHQYQVKTVDANTEESFNGIYQEYFQFLHQYIPEAKQGNFYNIGIDVLQNHMTAYLNFQDKNKYIHLVIEIIKNTFSITLEKVQIQELDKCVSDFFQQVEEYFLRLLEKENPGILGISVFKSTLPASLHAFKIAKEKYPHIQTVMGGGIFADQLAIGSPNLDLFIEKTPYIDKIIIGEGEQLFLKYLRKELPEVQKVYSLHDIENETIKMHEIGAPDFSDLDVGHYLELANFGSRSCPFQCGFCAETVNWGKYRKKDHQQVVKELIQLNNKYGQQLFLMTDSVINPIIFPLAKEIIESGEAIYWDAYLRVDKQVRSIENTLLWRQGGFYRARLGLESGSDRILKLMDKRISKEQILSALASLSFAGIKTTTYWIIGYPGETEEDFQLTLKLLKEAKDMIYEAECNPFRFYLSGQVKSSQWKNEKQSRPLYTGEAREKLLLQTWEMIDPEMSRELINHRMSRFVHHCQQLGIPNPYSWQDIFYADQRWKRLHKNAVPSIEEFKGKGVYIDDRGTVKKMTFAGKLIEDKDDFIF